MLLAHSLCIWNSDIRTLIINSRKNMYIKNSHKSGWNKNEVPQIFVTFKVAMEK